MVVRAELEQALAPLWSLRPPIPGNILQHPAYLTFQRFCQERFAAADEGLGISFALWDALRALSVPASLTSATSETAPGQFERAVDAILAALSATSATRRYLCPFDMADTLPAIAFGPARVATFSPASLAAALGAERLSRHFPCRNLELDKLARFQWLVVEEAVALPGRIGERALPFLYQNLGADIGAITPHSEKYPAAVGKALFALLLLPWEDWHSYGEMDWRGFQLPWTHLYNDDLFAKPRMLPAADTLTWEPAAFEGDDGEPVEYERPLQIHLDEDARAQLRAVDHGFWERLEAARGSVLFETPVEHFMVRAYFSSGMDEIIAHMTAIEAALGLRGDFGGSGSSKGKGATKRLIDRVAALLSDPGAGAAYKELFELRSAFIHGRAMSGVVSSNQRNQARRLARRISMALVDSANSQPTPASREDFLNQLG